MPQNAKSSSCAAAVSSPVTARPGPAFLAAAGLALALVALMQSQLQRAQVRGQETLSALIAEGEMVEDRIIAHIEHIRPS